MRRKLLTSLQSNQIAEHELGDIKKEKDCDAQNALKPIFHTVTEQPNSGT